ncbi:MAG: glycosyltransferase family 4 protein [Candidatus Wallbacteria bacterium]|nr:glycosyltransferase family 4 protein [Candidatus Wallbacteria bacterium]
MTTLNYLGLLRSVVSWARIGREICIELNCRSDLSIVEERGFLYSPDFTLPEQLEACVRKNRNREFELAFIYPPHYHRMEGKMRMAGMVYETSRLPAQWVDCINRYLHFLWVPNRFNNELAQASGVTVPTVVAPYGVNRRQFFPCPEKRSSDTFVFLTMAMPQRRKALDLLIMAFYKAFPDETDVRLHIKTPYKLHRFAFEYQAGELEKLISDSRVTLFDSQCDDIGLRNLYWSADCYVQPSRSEGFGLTLLEAMACGVPVLSTAYGGPAEFLTEGNSRIVTHRIVRAGNVQYDSSDPEALIGEPEMDSLVQALRDAYQDRMGNLDRAQNALSSLSPFDWGKTAEVLLTKF